MNGQAYLDEMKDRYQSYQSMAEKTLTQLSDDDFFRQPTPHDNSIAITVKHLAGNSRSRWRNFLTEDGEKPDRNRDTEFELSESDTRESIMAAWRASWEIIESELGALTEADLDRTVTIRGEPHLVVQALGRNLTHLAYHVGQIVWLARHLLGDKWQTLSIPKGSSQAQNDRYADKFGDWQKSK